MGKKVALLTLVGETHIKVDFGEYIAQIDFDNNRQVHLKLPGNPGDRLVQRPENWRNMRARPRCIGNVTLTPYQNEIPLVLDRDADFEEPPKPYTYEHVVISNGDDTFDFVFLRRNTKDGAGVLVEETREEAKAPA
jgi:hypothetical protein